MDLFGCEGGAGLFEDLEDGPAPWSGLEARLFEGIRYLGVGVTHHGGKVGGSGA